MTETNVQLTLEYPKSTLGSFHLKDWNEDDTGILISVEEDGVECLKELFPEKTEQQLLRAKRELIDMRLSELNGITNEECSYKWTPEEEALLESLVKEGYLVENLAKAFNLSDKLIKSKIASLSL